MYAIQIHQCPPFICHQNSQLRCTNRHVYLRKPWFTWCLCHIVFLPIKSLVVENLNSWKKLMSFNELRYFSSTSAICTCFKLKHSSNKNSPQLGENPKLQVNLTSSKVPGNDQLCQRLLLQHRHRKGRSTWTSHAPYIVVAYCSLSYVSLVLLQPRKKA